MTDKEKYWNPILGKLPQEKLRKLQLAGFKKFLAGLMNTPAFTISCTAMPE
jgi:hypothetical protein